VTAALPPSAAVVVVSGAASTANGVDEGGTAAGAAVGRVGSGPSDDVGRGRGWAAEAAIAVDACRSVATVVASPPVACVDGGWMGAAFCSRGARG
jgi:hypothetical protein